MQQKTKAFTLVELIVVITILAILGTIAFITLQGYSAEARDSKRLADIQNIKKSLELFSLNTGKYPLPDNGAEIEYDNELVWTQGIIGENVTKNLYKNLSELPLDPKTELEYTYSLINSNNKYELLSIYESDLLSKNSLINKSLAASSDFVRVDGTYNGIFVKTTSYYIPSPSILTSENISGGLILDENNIKSQITNAGKNKIEIGLTASKTGELNIKLSIYTGSISKESSDSDKQNLVNIIQEAYTGSSIANEGLYKMILEKTDINDVVNLVDNVILKDTNYATKTYKSCLSGTINGITYPSITYSYGEIKSGSNITGTGSQTSTSGIQDYSGTITCIDGEISITNESETITCNSDYIANSEGICILKTLNRTVEYNNIRADRQGGGMLVAKCPTGYYIKNVEALYKMNNTRASNRPVMHNMDLWNNSNSRVLSHVGTTDYSRGTNRSNFWNSWGFSSYKRNINLSNNTNKTASIVSYDIGSYSNNNRSDGRNIHITNRTPSNFSYDTNSTGIIKGGNTHTSQSWTNCDNIKMNVTCSALEL